MTPARRTLAALAGLLALAGAQSARAEDFSISVPVRVTNLLPTVTMGVVACVAGPQSVAAAARPNPHAADRIGSGAETFRVDRESRGFVGTVVVSFDADPGKDVVAATHYKCWLQLGTGPDGRGGMGAPRSEATEPHLLPRPNTPATLVITGELPR
jgi:hypothetical protein